MYVESTIFKTSTLKIFTKVNNFLKKFPIQKI